MFHEGRLLRYVQDCYPIYGRQVRAFDIHDLTPTSYSESENPHSPICVPTGSGWNASGMHHVDPHRIETGKWLACVDGMR